MMPIDTFTHRAETLIDEIHNSPRAEGVDRLYVPGEMEWERYDKSIREGIGLPQDVRESLKQAADMAGLDFEAAVA
jgi:LDH2 family malate/lactate/ureidoglycolate dehydrogenase